MGLGIVASVVEPAIRARPTKISRETQKVATVLYEGKSTRTSAAHIITATSTA